MGYITSWHRGEQEVRNKLGYDKVPSTALLFRSIAEDLPEEHSEFHSTRVSFLPVVTLDEEGRPWGSVLTTRSGQTGFIRYPGYSTETLIIEADLWNGDPLQNATSFQGEVGSMLIAGIGIELSTRRRNKFAGSVVNLQKTGNAIRLELAINEALGNCPKYITLRQLAPYAETSPMVLYQKMHLSTEDKLPGDLISFIHESDTTFLGTTYMALPYERQKNPSHLGMNHRGGRPGFIRVKPSNQRTLVLPDLSGNRFMTSLGNVEATPLASLTFISFTEGNILYLTGSAKNLYGVEAREVMPLQDTVTEVFVTGYTYVRDALPLRQRAGVGIQASPYSPPVKLLADETPQSNIFSKDAEPSASLTRIEIHSPTIATFVWESSVKLSIRPGQAVILDLSSLLGSREYKHMSTGRPSLVNDDFIRTWTVSSSAEHDSDSRLFSLTMREKVGGTVTTALFNVIRKLSQYKPEALGDSRVLGLTVAVVGVTGDFFLRTPEAVTNVDRPRTLFWISGGIGITPFLSMLAALKHNPGAPTWDITLVVSTREPQVILSLIETSLQSSNPHIQLFVHVFTHVTSRIQSKLSIDLHPGRLEPSFFESQRAKLKAKNTEVFVCGPQPFEQVVLDYLNRVGIEEKNVQREVFSY